MDRKEDIIGLDWNNSHWMSGLVLLLNTVNPEECNIIAAIQRKSNNVESKKVKVQTNYTKNDVLIVSFNECIKLYLRVNIKDSRYNE